MHTPSMNINETQRIPLQLSQGCIIASMQIELTDEVLYQFRQDLLGCLHTHRAKGVILDVSGVEIMDLADFEAIRRILGMVEMMGARTILSGFQPGVVSCLVDLNAEIDDIHAASDLDQAFRLVHDWGTATQDTFSRYSADRGAIDETPLSVLAEAEVAPEVGWVERDETQHGLHPDQRWLLGDADAFWV